MFSRFSRLSFVALLGIPVFGVGCGGDGPVKRPDGSTVNVRDEKLDARRGTTTPGQDAGVNPAPSAKNDAGTSPSVTMDSSVTADSSVTSHQDAAVSPVPDDAAVDPPRVPYAPEPPAPRDHMASSPLIIDDFEDCNDALYPSGGRVGSWFNYRDEANILTYVDPFNWTAITGGAPQSTNCSVRVVGQIAGNSYGGTGVATTEANANYDSSPYSGISFWAKGTGVVRFGVQTEAILPMTAAGTCEMNCYDLHGTDVELTPEWKKYEFTWEMLTQEGWGFVAAFDKTKTRNLQWQFKEGLFDLYLDDVRYLSGGATPGDGGAKRDAPAGKADAGAGTDAKRDAAPDTKK